MPGESVFLIGSGAREFSTASHLLKNPDLQELIVAPGSDAIELLDMKRVKRYSDLKSIDQWVSLAEERLSIGPQRLLVIVGPEAPLIAGVSNRMEGLGIPVASPSKEAAHLEGSKSFAMDVLSEVCPEHVPSYAYFDKFDEAQNYIKLQQKPLVVKADGPAAGKGSVVCSTTGEALKAAHDAMVNKVFGDSGNRILIQERLYGIESSFFFVTDGNTVLPFSNAHDFPHAYEAETKNEEGSGPITGGMGSYSPDLNYEHSQTILNKIAIPLLNHYKSRYGITYKGIGFIGIMLVKENNKFVPKVLEINVRGGDPEMSVNYPRLQTDLLEVNRAIATGNLHNINLQWSNDFYLALSMVSGKTKGSKGWYAGYPGRYGIGKTITGLEKVGSGVEVVHAGTEFDKATRTWKTSGGRVLLFVAGGETKEKAGELVYQEAPKVKFEGARTRKDLPGGPQYKSR